MTTKRRQTGCGCLILVVIFLALLIVSGRATEARNATKTATPTPDASMDAHGFPVGYTARLLSPMGMSQAQSQCVSDHLEQTQNYATIQAVLLTATGRQTLVADVHAIVARDCAGQ